MQCNFTKKNVTVTSDMTVLETLRELQSRNIWNTIFEKTTANYEKEGCRPDFYCHFLPKNEPYREGCIKDVALKLWGPVILQFCSLVAFVVLGATVVHILRKNCKTCWYKIKTEGYTRRERNCGVFIVLGFSLLLLVLLAIQFYGIIGTTINTEEITEQAAAGFFSFGNGTKTSIEEIEQLAEDFSFFHNQVHMAIAQIWGLAFAEISHADKVAASNASFIKDVLDWNAYKQVFEKISLKALEDLCSEDLLECVKECSTELLDRADGGLSGVTKTALKAPFKKFQGCIIAQCKTEKCRLDSMMGALRGIDNSWGVICALSIIVQLFNVLALAFSAICKSGPGTRLMLWLQIVPALTLIAMMSLGTLRGTSAIAACDMVADAYQYGLDYTLGPYLYDGPNEEIRAQMQNDFKLGSWQLEAYEKGLCQNNDYASFMPLSCGTASVMSNPTSEFCHQSGNEVDDSIGISSEHLTFWIGLLCFLVILLVGGPVLLLVGNCFVSRAVYYTGEDDWRQVNKHKDNEDRISGLMDLCFCDCCPWWCKLTGSNRALRSVQGNYATKSLRRKEVFVSNSLGDMAVTVDQYRGVMLPVTYLVKHASGNVSGQGFIKLEVWRHTITIIDEDGHAVTSPINDKFIDSYSYGLGTSFTLKFRERVFPRVCVCFACRKPFEISLSVASIDDRDYVTSLLEAACDVVRSFAPDEDKPESPQVDEKQHMSVCLGGYNMPLELTVFISSMNMGQQYFDDMETWLPNDRYDVYAVGLQEKCPQDIGATIKKHFGDSYICLSDRSMGEIRNMVFIRKSLTACIEPGSVEELYKAVGLAGMGKNKGAVAMACVMFGCRMLFVSSHLAAHEKEKYCERRNRDAKAIAASWPFGVHDVDAMQQHTVFWYGDLNYRLALPRTNALNMVRQQRWEELYATDQLKREMEAGRVFHGFKEMAPLFPPTFKVVPFPLKCEPYVDPQTGLTLGKIWKDIPASPFSKKRARHYGLQLDCYFMPSVLPPKAVAQHRNLRKQNDWERGLEDMYQKSRLALLDEEDEDLDELNEYFDPSEANIVHPDFYVSDQIAAEFADDLVTQKDNNTSAAAPATPQVNASAKVNNNSTVNDSDGAAAVGSPLRGITEETKSDAKNASVAAAVPKDSEHVNSDNAVSNDNSVAAREISQDESPLPQGIMSPKANNSHGSDDAVSPPPPPRGIMSPKANSNPEGDDAVSPPPPPRGIMSPKAKNSPENDDNDASSAVVNGVNDDKIAAAASASATSESAATTKSSESKSNTDSVGPLVPLAAEKPRILRAQAVRRPKSARKSKKRRYYQRREYVSRKKLRIPSWCDRVLHRTMPGGPEVEQTEFFCREDVHTSDHVPVCAVYKVRFPVLKTRRIVFGVYSIRVVNVRCTGLVQFVQKRTELLNGTGRRFSQCEKIVVSKSGAASAAVASLTRDPSLASVNAGYEDYTSSEEESSENNEEIKTSSFFMNEQDDRGSVRSVSASIEPKEKKPKKRKKNKMETFLKEEPVAVGTNRLRMRIYGQFFSGLITPQYLWDHKGSEKRVPLVQSKLHVNLSSHRHVNEDNKTAAGSKEETNDHYYQWKDENIPTIFPLLTTAEFLESQCLHIQLSARVSRKVHGFALIPLKKATADGGIAFEVPVELHGQHVGSMTGRVYVVQEANRFPPTDPPRDIGPYDGQQQQKPEPAVADGASSKLHKPEFLKAAESGRQLAREAEVAASINAFRKQSSSLSNRKQSSSQFRKSSLSAMRKSSSPFNAFRKSSSRVKSMKMSNRQLRKIEMTSYDNSDPNDLDEYA